MSKYAEKTRQPKSVSFDLTDAYEVDLLNYAEDEKHGNFSEFVKRLIARHKDGMQPQHVILDVPANEESEKDKEAMNVFL